ncbi:MAG TPA: ribosomal protein L7/L12 [Vicinamibacterales bacterium]|nr:ribosomal protein L7/L12 [Vicinamibacterales bacterium]
MNESFLLGLVVAWLIAGALMVRRGSEAPSSAALFRLEAKLDALLKHQGIRFDPYADSPPRVVDALRRGKKIEAIKEYRAATGAGLKEAREYVEELQRQAVSRA